MSYTLRDTSGPLVLVMEAIRLSELLFGSVGWQFDVEF
jgi:hypothetical protein